MRYSVYIDGKLHAVTQDERMVTYYKNKYKDQKVVVKDHHEKESSKGIKDHREL